MASTTGTALRDDFTTQLHYELPAKLQVGRGGWVELCQVIKGGRHGGKYNKCPNLHARLTNRGSPQHQIPDCKCFL